MAFLDISKIGINMEILPDTFASLQHYETLDPLIRRVDANAIQFARVARTRELVPGSSVTINGTQYIVEAHLGGGTYGKVGRVRASNGHTYAMKVQFSEVGDEGNTYRHRYYLEAFTQIVVCFHSFDGDCARVPFLYQIGVDHATGHVFFIMEMIHATARSLLGTHGATPSQKATITRDFLRESSSLFDKLTTQFFFNHGDCKDDNIGISSDGRFKLLDFGFSTIDLPGMGSYFISEFVTNSNFSRDITQLAYSLYFFGNGVEGLDGPAFFTRVKEAVENILSMEGCDLLNLPQVCFGMNVADWRDTYDLFNHHGNPNGFPKNVYETMRGLTLNNPVYDDCLAPLFPEPPPGYLPPAAPAPAALAAVVGHMPEVAPPSPPPAVIDPVAVPAMPMAAIAAAGAAILDNVNHYANVLGGGLGHLAGIIAGWRGNGGAHKKKKLIPRHKKTHKRRKHGRKHTRKSSKRRAV
jgi:hypothetical protein